MLDFTISIDRCGPELHASIMLLIFFFLWIEGIRLLIRFSDTL